ncbi:hypothetical protein [Candidatus Lokiarchaeum ossiferum]|uniref:hypothetical protein n=1 Tax=Candidatus Lokiarchaeum ossiferum TaxID=2951803 RepID=UPI00352DC4C6
MESPQGKKFLRILQNSLSPFENFVAKLDIDEPLNLVDNRQYIIKQLIDLLNFEDPAKIIPIAGDTGQGKTYICWEIKKNLQIHGSPIFFQVPANSKLFYYDLYTKIIEEIGAEKLRDITTKISNRWGASEIKYGLFRTTNSEKVISRAKLTTRYKWSKYPKELEDCIRAIIIHAMDPEASHLAERWLLGEIMDSDELFFLGIENNLSAKVVAEELLKLIADYLDDGIYLIYDDLDKNWVNFSHIQDIDDDWANSLEEDSPDVSSSSTDISFFEQLVQVLNELNKVKIVFTMDYSSKDEILSHFPESIADFISPIIPLNNFSSRDTKQYYKEALKLYLKKNQMDYDLKNPLFPLNEIILKGVFRKIHGNPRLVIREFQQIFDEIIFDGVSISELEAKYSLY